MSTDIATPVTGLPRIWARDMALFGGVTSAIVPLLLIDFAPTHYWLVAGVLGALTGAALGRFMPGFLDRMRGRVSLPLLFSMGVPIGGAWGATVGALATVPYVVMDGQPVLLVLGVACAGVAGAVQFGWWWFPYTFQTVRKGRTWPVTALGLVATPLLAFCSFMAAMFLMS